MGDIREAEKQIARGEVISLEEFKKNLTKRIAQEEKKQQTHAR